jgi:hypothetical protein
VIHEASVGLRWRMPLRSATEYMNVFGVRQSS